MTTNGTLQILVYFAIIVLIAKPVGTYIAKVFEGETTLFHRVLGWLERGTYKLLGIDAEHDMKWTTYCIAMLVFSGVGLLVTYGLLRLQGLLPLNPQHLGAKQMPAHLAFNTAVSFSTNTNWQNYSPEVT